MLERITFEPGKLGGKACIRGLRVSVAQVLACLAGGMTPEEILAEYPYLEREDVSACLAYASQVIAGEEVHPVSV